MNDPEIILRATEEVIGILKQSRIDAVVIGAVALAAHHYGLDDLLAETSQLHA